MPTPDLGLDDLGLPLGDNVAGYDSFDFPRIVMNKPATATSKGTFEIPMEPPKTVPEFYAVILHSSPGRSYFLEQEEREDDNKMPLCFSNDGEYPVASGRAIQNPTCSGCPRNQWRSNPRGGRDLPPECQEARRLFLYNPKYSPSPLFMRAPSRSLGHIKIYQGKLLAAHHALAGVMTKFSTTTQADGQYVWSELQLEAHSRLKLGSEPLEQVKALKAAYQTLMEGSYLKLAAPATPQRLPSGKTPDEHIEAMGRNAEPRAGEEPRVVHDELPPDPLAGEESQALPPDDEEWPTDSPATTESTNGEEPPF